MKYYKTLCLDKVIVQLKEYLINNNQNKNIQYSLNLAIPEVSDEESLFNYFCSRIYIDAENIVKTNKNIFQFPKDLFIEQCKFLLILLIHEHKYTIKIFFSSTSVLNAGI